MHLKSVIKIRITGKNTNRFLRKIINKKIEILEINEIDYKTIDIKIYDKDYDEIIKLKTIYEVEIIDTYGYKKLKKIIKLNKYLIIFIIIGFIILLFLTNTIFEVEVIHNDKEIRKILTQELDKYGIKKFNMVKNYHQIEKIKENILKDYKDKIEWLEIERIGTKYVVRVEERILNSKKEKTELRHVVAKKNAIIKDVYAESGDVLKRKNDYVKKGDIIISGTISLNEDVKSSLPAKGVVYGEVWYNVKVEMPYYNYEKIKTGKKNNVITLKILNHRFELFNFHKYKTKDIKSKTLLKSNLIPISLNKEFQEETVVSEKVYLKEEAISQTEKKAKEEIQKKLDEKEKIISIKKLHVSENNSKIIVDYFVTVYKNITDYKSISMEELDVRNSEPNQ